MRTSLTLLAINYLYPFKTIPTVVSMPNCSLVMMLSFSTIGIPCSGPLIFPRNLSSSSFFAIFNNSCFGATDISARSCRPLRLCCSIWCKYNSTISTLDIACAFISSDRSNAETTSGSNSGSIPIPPSVDEVIDILRAACIFSAKSLDGVESGFGESAFLKNLDAFLMFVGSPLAPSYFTCSPAVPVRGVEHRGKSNAGFGGSNFGRSKEKEHDRFSLAASCVSNAECSRSGSQLWQVWVVPN
jgi:hypothetical protein